MKTKWSINGHNLTSVMESEAPHKHICSCDYGYAEDGTGKEHARNVEHARLIAAAPELLEALGNALFYLKERAPREYASARAAIAKATTEPRPAMTAAEHNAFPKGRW